MKLRLLFLCLIILIGSSLGGCTAAAKKARWLARAEHDFKAGEYDKAKIEYIKVIQIDPKDAIAFQQLGTIWLDEGAPLRAGAFLKRAQELAPHDAGNNLRLAKVYNAIGQHDQAMKEIIGILQQSATDGDALVFLTEMARTPEDISTAEQALQKFPDKGTASYQLATANIALRKPDLAVAEKAVNEAVSLAPKSPDARQALGILYLLQKNPKEAAEEFKKAADLAPMRSNIRMVYAEYQRQVEGNEAAAASMKELTKSVPDFLPAWIFLGRIAFVEKKYDEALKSLENVFSRDPLNVDARLLQSDTWLAQHDPKKAIEELDRLDKAYPDLPAVKYRLAQAYLQQNNPVQAATALDQAIAKNPNFPEAILLRAQLNLRTGHIPVAVTSLEELLKKQPGLRPAQLVLADAYRASGRLDDAANIFRDQIKAMPNAPEAYFFLGVVLEQQKKSDEARKSFEKVLELAPENLLAVDQLIDLDLQSKNFDDANRRVQHQLEKQPAAAPSYLLQGKVRMAQAQWAEAEAALKKALELDPNSGPAYDMLVQSYLATNKLPEAVRELETVLSKAPQNQSVLMTLATIQERQKDFSKARDAYEKLLTINPNFVPALNNLSYVYAERLNQPEKAIALAQQARKLDPSNPAVADTLGWAFFKSGDYQQALTLLQESADKLPSIAEVQFHLGMAHYMMGDADPARTAFQHAISDPGDFPSKSEAENRLALLGAAPGSTAELTEEQLAQMLQRQPNDVVARLRLAAVYEKQGEWSKAAEAYEAALKLNPKLASATLKLAQIYSGPIPNKEKALAFAKTARSLLPDDPKATAVLGRVAFDTGDFVWSYSLLQESARQLDSDPKILRDYAWAAYSNGKVEEARAAMDRCLKASPDATIADDAKSFLELTSSEFSGADAKEGRAVIQAKLSGQPKYVPALMADATLDLSDGKKAEAIKRYQNVLQEYPDFAPAQKELAALYAEDSAKMSDAYELAVKARKALPDDPAVAQILGQLNYVRKEYPRALQLLQESASKKPLDAVGLYYLGLSYQEARQPEKASGALTAALARGLPAPLAKDAARSLAELKQSKAK